MTAALTFAFMVMSVLVVAVLVSPRVAGPDALDRFFVGVLLVLVQGAGIPLVAAELTHLSRGLVLVLHAATVAAALLWTRPWVRAASGEPSAAPQPTEPRERTIDPVFLLAVGAGAAYVALGLYLSLRTGRSLDFDTKEYHVVNMTSWLQSGSLWHLPFAGPGSITATHPGNGEMFAAWLTLPTGGDEIVYAMPTCFGLLAILATAVAARELAGLREGAAAAGAIAAAAVVTAPIFFTTQTDSLSTDMPSAAPLLAGLALVLVARRRPSTATVVLAGAALGLGLGAKYTGLVGCACIALGAIVILRRSRAWFWLVPGVALLAAPWFIRNLALVGNPLFPQPLPGLTGGDTPVDVLDTSMLHQITAFETEAVKLWFRLVRQLVGPVLLLVVAGVAGVFRRRPDRTPALVVAAVLLVTYVGFLVTPYTGGGPDGTNSGLIASTFRYSLLAMLIGVSLAAGVLAPRITAVVGGLILAWNAWQLRGTAGRPDLSLRSLTIAGGIAAGVVVAAVVLVALRSGWLERLRPSPRLVGGVVVGAVLVATAGGVILFHRNDRTRQTSGIEARLLLFGPRTPTAALGVVDHRAVLGPRLERPLIRVGRGGKADEIPFVDRNQVRRNSMGDTSAPPEPPELGIELDAALDRSGAGLLVLGNGPVGFPIGWTPKSDWCFVGADPGTKLYARPAMLGLTACPPTP